MSCLWAAFFLLFASEIGDEFRARAKELSKAIQGGKPRIERETAIKQIGSFPGPDPTELLIEALDESIGEQQSLDKVFAAMTTELSDVLEGRVDIRLVGGGTREKVDQRRDLGQRIIDESELCEVLLTELGKRKDAESVELLAKELAKARDWRMRLRLMEVAGKLGSPEFLPTLHKALGDKDARVRMFAADAIGKVGSTDSLGPLTALLEDKEWQVRAFAVEAFAALGAPASVPELINALTREKGRLQHELSDLLERLTGQSLGFDAIPWQRWWGQHGEAFLGANIGRRIPKVDTNAKEEGSEGFSYYGIETKSNKVIFILDISDSMNDDAGETEVPPDGIPKRSGNLRPKIRVARDKLVEAILDLPADSTFNIIIYNKYVAAWRAKMEKATKRNKNDAFEYIMGLKAKEATNIFDALELAFKFGGRYLGDKHYASPVDTIFFLTDGKATEGRIQDPERILAEVRRINRIGKITIHTIGAGYLHDRDFLKSLAEQNGGQYVAVQ